MRDSGARSSALHGVPHRKGRQAFWHRCRQARPLRDGPNDLLWPVVAHQARAWAAAYHRVDLRVVVRRHDAEEGPRRRGAIPQRVDVLQQHQAPLRIPADVKFGQNCIEALRAEAGGLQHLQRLLAAPGPPDNEQAPALRLLRRAPPAGLRAPVATVGSEGAIHPEHPRRAVRVGRREPGVAEVHQAWVAGERAPAARAEEQRAAEVSARRGVGPGRAGPAPLAVADRGEPPEGPADVVLLQQRRSDLATNSADRVRITANVQQPCEPVPSALGTAAAPQGDEHGVEPPLAEAHGLAVSEAEVPAF
mmetsp:Transcript_123044/g.342699  ORF Transcript_123044/g.342699 Transcript_123044/m.342699 type:complete len:306 (-) Transcript_123044:360-1277(-)